MGKLSFALVVSALLLTTVSAGSEEQTANGNNSEPKCGPNSSWSDCGTACPLTCQSPEPQNCIKICSPGCFCDVGYILNEDTDKCVPIDSCKCPANEVYSSCGSHCPPTCQNSGPDFCILSCKIGCFCKEGYRRDEKSGLCFPEEVCTCGANSTFNSCGSACPPTCQNPEPRACPKICKVGCQCDEGFLLDEDLGDCVPEEECSCGEGEVFKNCGSDCPESCQQDEEPQFCTKQCVRGCFCRDGLVRDKLSGNCVLRKNCPIDDGCEK